MLCLLKVLQGTFLLLHSYCCADWPSLRLTDSQPIWISRLTSNTHILHVTTHTSYWASHLTFTVLLVLNWSCLDAYTAAILHVEKMGTLKSHKKFDCMWPVCETGLFQGSTIWVSAVSNVGMGLKLWIDDSHAKWHTPHILATATHTSYHTLCFASDVYVQSF